MKKITLNDLDNVLISETIEPRNISSLPVDDGIRKSELIKLITTRFSDSLNNYKNGALNILRKSNVVSLETLYIRGEVDTPVRIRIA